MSIKYLWSWKLLSAAEVHQQTCVRRWPAAWYSLGLRQEHLSLLCSRSNSWSPCPEPSCRSWSWRVGRCRGEVWLHHYYCCCLLLNLLPNSGATWQPAWWICRAALRHLWHGGSARFTGPTLHQNKEEGCCQGERLLTLGGWPLYFSAHIPLLCDNSEYIQVLTTQTIQMSIRSDYTIQHIC